MERVKSFLHHPTRPLLTVLGLGLAMRIVLCFAAAGILWPDSFAYYRSASLMARDGNYIWHEVYRTPFYSFFLSLFFEFGRSLTTGFVVIASQHLLGLVSTYLTYRVARQLFGPGVAFFAALLYALHPLALYWEKAIHTETLFQSLLMLALWQYLRVIKSPSGRNFVLLGIVAALATLTRPIAQFFLLLLLAGIFWQLWNPRACLRAALCVLLPYALLLLPWLLVNYSHFHFFGLSKEQGLNLYHRVIDIDRIPPVAKSRYDKVARAYRIYNKQHEITYFYVYNHLRRKLRSPVRADKLMGAFAWEALKANPQGFLPNTVKTFFNLFFDPRESAHFCPSPYGRYLCCKTTLPLAFAGFPNKPLKENKWAKRVVYQYFKYAPYNFAVFFWLGLLGAGWAVLQRQQRNGLVVLLLTVGYFLVVTAVFQRPEDRMRLPVDPLIFMFAMQGAAVALVALTALAGKARNRPPALKSRQQPA